MEKKFSNVKTYNVAKGCKVILQTARNASRKIFKGQKGGGYIATTYTVGPKKASSVLRGWHKVGKVYTGKNGSTWAMYQHDGGKIKRSVRFYRTSKNGYTRPAGLHAQVTTFTPLRSR